MLSLCQDSRYWKLGDCKSPHKSAVNGACLSVFMVCVYFWCVLFLLCVCVLERESERETERDRKK
jgi:hypothetical protein